MPCVCYNQCHQNAGLTWVSALAVVILSICTPTFYENVAAIATAPAECVTLGLT